MIRRALPVTDFMCELWTENVDTLWWTVWLISQPMLDCFEIRDHIQTTRNTHYLSRYPAVAVRPWLHQQYRCEYEGVDQPLTALGERSCVPERGAWLAPRDSYSAGDARFRETWSLP